MWIALRLPGVADNTVGLWYFRNSGLPTLAKKHRAVFPISINPQSSHFTNQKIMETKKGSCHCGAVEFEVELENGFENLRRCNCSLCRRKGSIMSSVPVGRLHITKGEDSLTLYQWNTMTAKHYFCKICGIYTHHQRRSNPNEFGFNIGCIEGVDPFDFTDIPVGNGASQSLVAHKKTH